MVTFALSYSAGLKFMNFLTYLLFRINVFFFQFVPFRLLYGLADLVFYIVYYIVGYRKKVVFRNLRNSFPRKTEKEIGRIARAFYHHLSDLLIESMKAFTMPEEQVVKRYRYLNTAFLEDLYHQGKSVICVAAHYGNWEWGGVASGTQLLHKPVGFYKPLSNRYIDRYVRKTRVKGRSELAPITQTAETFRRPYDEPVIFYMVADQSPSSTRLAIWVDFLNQDTATLHGPEKYARVCEMPVVYAVSRKIKRGYYEVDFKMLEPDPSETKTGGITRRFMKLLEEDIVREPRYYLWSHRRWKLSRTR